MQGLLAYLAPLALLVPPLAIAGGDDTGSPAAVEDARQLSGEQQQAGPLSLSGSQEAVALPFGEAFRPQNSAQVRIERRVTIRIAPRQPARSPMSPPRPGLP